MNYDILYTSHNLAIMIKERAKAQKIVIKDMLTELNLGSNTKSAMYHGQSIAYDSLAKIADYLDCSVDYLLGRSATPEINQPVKEQSEEITITYAAYGAGGKTVQKKVTPETMEKIKRLMSDD